MDPDPVPDPGSPTLVFPVRIIVYRAPEFLASRPTWVPHSLPRKQVCLPFRTEKRVGGRNTRLRVRGWKDPIRTTGQKACHSVYSVCLTFSSRKEGSVGCMTESIEWFIAGQVSCRRMMRLHAHPLLPTLLSAS